MITITILGLDPNPVRQYSLDHTANLANLFEVSSEEINFVYVESALFHNGVEQPSWHAIAIVYADKRCKPIEEKAAEYIMSTLTLFAINIEVRFDYFDEENVHYHNNPDYPPYLKEENITYMQQELDEAEEKAFTKLEHDHPSNEEEGEEGQEEVNEEEIYLGDAFAPYKDILDGKD